MRTDITTPQPAHTRQAFLSAREAITIADIVRAFGMSCHEAANRLSSWREKCWLHGIAGGTYISVALDTIGAEQALNDPG